MKRIAKEIRRCEHPRKCKKTFCVSMILSASFGKVHNAYSILTCFTFIHLNKKRTFHDCPIATLHDLGHHFINFSDACFKLEVCFCPVEDAHVQWTQVSEFWLTHPSVCYTYLKKQFIENHLTPPFHSVLALYPHCSEFCHAMLTSFLYDDSTSLLVYLTLLSIIFDQLFT